jgi:hypothetical protein
MSDCWVHSRTESHKKYNGVPTRQVDAIAHNKCSARAVAVVPRWSMRWRGVASRWRGVALSISGSLIHAVDAHRIAMLLPDSGLTQLHS